MTGRQRGDTVTLDLPAWAKIVMWAMGLLLPVMVTAVVAGGGWAWSLHNTVAEIGASQRETNALLRGELTALRGSIDEYKRTTDRRLDRHERELDAIRRPFGPQP